MASVWLASKEILAVLFKYDVNILLCARVFPPECDETVEFRRVNLLNQASISDGIGGSEVDSILQWCMAEEVLLWFLWASAASLISMYCIYTFCYQPLGTSLLHADPSIFPWLMAETTILLAEHSELYIFSTYLIAMPSGEL
jgi:hypothetical protein